MVRFTFSDAKILEKNACLLQYSNVLALEVFEQPSRNKIQVFGQGCNGGKLCHKFDHPINPDRDIWLLSLHFS